MCLCAAGCLPSYCRVSEQSRDERRNKSEATDIMLCFTGKHSLQDSVVTKTGIMY